MPDILHQFPVNAPAEKVFEAISTPAGLDSWWTKTSSGQAESGALFHFHFEPDYHWTGLVSKCVPASTFEFTMQTSDEDWEGTRVGFELTREQDGTIVRFYHTGWKTENQHFRISSFCWAMYLRLLKRNLETGEFVPYAERLSA